MAEPFDRPTTPAEALAELLAGNHRFVTGTRVHPHQDAEFRASIASEQRPFAVVFGCSDSRLAAEIIFDRGLGDLFVVRTAGHIVGEEVTASIEFGVTQLGVSLVAVLGHDNCGAIAAAHAAMTGARPPQNLSPIVERVLPSLLYTQAGTGDDLATLGNAHVLRTLGMLTSPGTAVADAVASGRCAVVGMSYRLADGRVSVISPAPVS